MPVPPLPLSLQLYVLLKRIARYTRLIREMQHEDNVELTLSDDSESNTSFVCHTLQIYEIELAKAKTKLAHSQILILR